MGPNTVEKGEMSSANANNVVKEWLGVYVPLLFTP